MKRTLFWRKPKSPLGLIYVPNYLLLQIIIEVFLELTMADFSSGLNETRDVLQKYHYGLKRLYFHGDGKHHWIIYNTIDDVAARVGTSLSHSQLDYFKNIVSLAFESVSIHTFIVVENHSEVT